MAILNKAAAVAKRVEIDITPVEEAINAHLVTQRVVDYLTNTEIDSPQIRVTIEKATLTVAAIEALEASITEAGWKEVKVTQEVNRLVVDFAVKDKVVVPDVYVATVTPANPTVVIGATVKLNVSVTKNGQPYTAAPTYVSSMPSRATVSSNGTVTGVAAGTVSVTVAEAGKYSAAKTVTVTA